MLLTLLTVSNHRPFLFPEGRVTAPPKTREGATRYADHALGQFFDTAEQEGFLRDTLFLIIGDHGPRSYTREKLPADAHRVPMLLLGAGVAPGMSAVIGSTIDVAPTLLGHLGLEAPRSFFGRDLATVTDGGRAFIQDKRDLAMLLPGALVAIGFGEHNERLPLSDDDRQGPAAPLAPSEPDARRAIGVFQSAWLLYSKGALAPSP